MDMVSAIPRLPPYLRNFWSISFEKILMAWSPALPCLTTLPTFFCIVVQFGLGLGRDLSTCFGQTRSELELAIMSFEKFLMACGQCPSRRLSPSSPPSLTRRRTLILPAAIPNIRLDLAHSAVSLEKISWGSAVVFVESSGISIHTFLPLSFAFNFFGSRPQFICRHHIHFGSSFWQLAFPWNLLAISLWGSVEIHHNSYGALRALRGFHRRVRRVLGAYSFGIRISVRDYASASSSGLATRGPLLSSVVVTPVHV
ncbi:hypothetical protein B0H11DRAFT_165989 [Mycena galericulata]|nr:hypothetical protein B0H11DRAFT_165989 [Mycena galericulata]